MRHHYLNMQATRENPHSIASPFLTPHITHERDSMSFARVHNDPINRKGVSVTMFMQLQSCGKCRGDLVLEEDEWRCLQCGRYYYPNPPCLEETDAVQGRKWLRRPSGGIAGRSINSVIETHSRRQARHPQVIAYLKEGRTVEEIAAITGLSPKVIRSVQEHIPEPMAA